MGISYVPAKGNTTSSFRFSMKFLVALLFAAVGSNAVPQVPFYNTNGVLPSMIDEDMDLVEIAKMITPLVKLMVADAGDEALQVTDEFGRFVESILPYFPNGRTGVAKKPTAKEVAAMVERSVTLFKRLGEVMALAECPKLLENGLSTQTYRPGPGNKVRLIRYPNGAVVPASAPALTAF